MTKTIDNKLERENISSKIAKKVASYTLAGALLFNSILPVYAVNQQDKEKMGQYFNQGTVYYKAGNYDNAISQWENVLKIDPNHQLSKQKIEIAKAEKAKYSQPQNKVQNYTPEKKKKKSILKSPYFWGGVVLIAGGAVYASQKKNPDPQPDPTPVTPPVITPQDTDNDEIPDTEDLDIDGDGYLNTDEDREGSNKYDKNSIPQEGSHALRAMSYNSKVCNAIENKSQLETKVSLNPIEKNVYFAVPINKNIMVHGSAGSRNSIYFSLRY